MILTVKLARLHQTGPDQTTAHYTRPKTRDQFVVKTFAQMTTLTTLTTLTNLTTLTTMTNLTTLAISTDQKN